MDTRQVFYHLSYFSVPSLPPLKGQINLCQNSTLTSYCTYVLGLLDFFWKSLPRSVPSSSSLGCFSSCSCLGSVSNLSSRISLARHWAGQKFLALQNRHTIQTRLIGKTWGLLNWKSKPTTTVACQCSSVAPGLRFSHSPLGAACCPPSKVRLETAFIKRSIILSETYFFSTTRWHSWCGLYPTCALPKQS